LLTSVTAAIQPSVPNTRASGNCFSGFVMWLKATVFDRPSVGM
jgi:hypothetical protein